MTNNGGFKLKKNISYNCPFKLLMIPMPILLKSMSRNLDHKIGLMSNHF